MWIIRWVFVLLIMVILLWFSLQNLDQFVTIKFWKYQVVDVPMIMALFVSFIIGALVWFLVALFQMLQVKTEMHGIRRENSKLQRELADLRNMSIEEDTPKLEKDNSGASD